MSKLSDLYKAQKTLEANGFEFSREQEERLRALEEDIIKRDILPLLTEKIEPALMPVERELVLVVDYEPNKPLSVRISRKRSFVQAIPDAKVIELDPIVEHSKRIQNNAAIRRGSATKFSVRFPDGTIIAEQKASDTLVEVVRKIGVAKVRSIVEKENLVFCHVTVISNRRDAKYGSTQKDLGGGWLLITHSNNLMKKSFLDKISKELHLGLEVKVEK